jgi:TolB-like protein/Tfp pilus assembly protein PilF
MTEFIARLKQRKLVQWALAYIAFAFASLQGVDVVAQQFAWPDNVRRGITLLLALGFFVALVLAWYHGERGAQRVSSTEIVILALLLAIGGGLLWRLARNTPASLASGANVAATLNATANAVSADRKSIAVLPFVNMSGDKDNAYFSDGVSEEILNVLARTPDLHVAARTSSFSFQGKAMEIPAIARALGVRMVLEGSVRKQGDRVRIAAQLIDAATDNEVWSQTYDRELKDIFAIQDDIAKSIGDELEIKLADAPQPGKNSVGTTNLKAYDLYLRGIALWQQRQRGDALWQAIDLFDQSTKADPKFAQGYAGQALVYSVLGDYSARISFAEAMARATDLAERALALDPSSPEAYAALGMVSTYELRRPTADALLGRAIELRPSFATAYQWRGTLLMSSGDLTGGLALLERASALDPRSLIVAENHAFALRTLGRDAEAKALCMRILAFAPTYSLCTDDVAMVDLRARDYAGARAELERLAAMWNPSAAAQGRELTNALAGRGDRHALAVRYAALPANSQLDPASGNALQDYDLAAVIVMLGEPGLALSHLELNAGTTDAFADWAIMLPALDPIRCEPRFIAVVKKMKTTDPYYAKVCGGKHG